MVSESNIRKFIFFIYKFVFFLALTGLVPGQNNYVRTARFRAHPWSPSNGLIEFKKIIFRKRSLKCFFFSATVDLETSGDEEPESQDGNHFSFFLFFA